MTTELVDAIIESLEERPKDWAIYRRSFGSDQEKDICTISGDRYTLTTKNNTCSDSKVYLANETTGVILRALTVIAGLLVAIGWPVDVIVKPRADLGRHDASDLLYAVSEWVEWRYERDEYAVRQRMASDVTDSLVRMRV